MKKIVTFLMVVAMLASMLAIGVSAEQSNMDVTIPKFTKQPVFDGCVTPEEWGEKTISVVTDGAATTEDTEVADNGAGLKNYFYWFAAEGIADSLSYDVWLRWDDQNLYVAAIVNDPDPFSLPTGGKEIWNGDCFQIRIDEAGPNAVMKKSKADYDYKVDAFNGNRFKTPWANDKNTFNSILGLVKEETPTQWRCGPNYDDGWNLKDDGGIVGITYVPNEDGETGVITYEAAFPWAAVNATYAPKAGDVLGVGIAVACSDSNELNASLQWGSGTMNVDDQPKGTRGGSQAVTLGTDEIAPQDGHALATEPEETEDPTISLAPVATGNNDDAADKDDNKDAADKNDKNDNKKPANTSPADKDGEGLDTWVWIVIAVAAVAVIAVVVIVIKKKKN